MNQRAKNHGLFLRAAARVSAKFSAVEFVLVGDGPSGGELERQVKDLGLLDRVRFLGDRRDIPSVLASLDITVLPRLSESLSNANYGIHGRWHSCNCQPGRRKILNSLPGSAEFWLQRMTSKRSPLPWNLCYATKICAPALDTMLGRMLLANFTIDEVRKQYERALMSTSFNGRVHEEHAMQAHF